MRPKLMIMGRLPAACTSGGPPRLRKISEIQFMKVYREFRRTTTFPLVLTTLLRQRLLIPDAGAVHPNDFDEVLRRRGGPPDVQAAGRRPMIINLGRTVFRETP